MTHIKIFRQNKSIIGFECSGHTGYDVEGSDIVCAAISTLTLTCILGLEKVQNQNVDVRRDDKKGYLKVVLKTTDLKKIEESQVLFETMAMGLKEIQSAYKKYIKLEDDYEIF